VAFDPPCESAPRHFRVIGLQLHTRILLGLGAGALTGVTVNLLAGEADWVEWINHYITGPIGQIFLRLLFMVIIPLVFATLTLGVAALGDLRNLGRIGGRTFGYFIVTTAVAVTIGLTLTNLVRPGDGIPNDVTAELIASFAGDADSRLAASGANDFGIATFVDIVPRNPLKSAVDTQMLQLIFFSVMFGIALALIRPERAAPVLRFMEGLADAVTKLIEITMRFAPYGVFALIFVTTSRFGWTLIGHLGLFVMVVLVGLALHCFVTFTLALRFVAGLPLRQFWLAIRDALVTAFSTSSSNATLPTSILVAERQLGIPAPIAGFVLPMGATMNMNGTALFEGVAVLFVAQVFGIELTLVNQLVVVGLAVLTAIGAAGVPGGSIPLLMVMAASVGVPAEGIAIILGVDRLLDMSRTTVNVAGDLTATCVVARLEGAWTAQMVPRTSTSGAAVTDRTSAA
jgi:DAACS family dicarboxylate/amino acid:cation (Na+ or H+) symporter